MSTRVATRRLLTVAEIAERLRVSERTVHRWIATGSLRALQPGGPGGSLRVDEAELAARQAPGVTDRRADG